MAFFQRTRTPFAEKALEVASPLGPRSAGDVLRRRREALGCDLADVAAALKIKPAYLAALEAGRPEELPGRTYGVGFLRAYSDHLGLDTGEILRCFKAESPVLDAKPDLSFPMLLSERGTPGGAMLLVALILALCGYATWYWLSSAERSRPERVAAVPASLLPPEQPATEPAVSHSAEALAEPRAAAPAAEMPVQPDAASMGSGLSGALAAAAPALPPAGAPIAVPQGVTQSSAIAPAPSPPENSPSTADGPARIIIRATGDSWIQIRDANQSVLFTGVLKGGEDYHVPDRPRISMRTSNAGGLRILVDGNPVPSIGTTRAVRRDIALDPQALIAGTAIRR